MTEYVAACTEELSEETIQAMWDGSQVAKEKDVAYAVMLNLSQGTRLLTSGFQSTISHEDLMKAQIEDTTISKVI